MRHRAWFLFALTLLLHGVTTLPSQAESLNVTEMVPVTLDAQATLVTLNFAQIQTLSETFQRLDSALASSNLKQAQKEFRYLGTQGQALLTDPQGVPYEPLQKIYDIVLNAKLLTLASMRQYVSAMAPAMQALINYQTDVTTAAP